MFHFSGMYHASYTFLGFQDTWEEVDPDELSYEVSLDLDSGASTWGFYSGLLNVDCLNNSGIACIG